MAQVTNYLQNMEAARRKTLEAGSAAEDASAKFERQNQAMREVGVRMTAFGAVALVATGLAVKAAIDWESAWTGVTKTVDGSAAEMSVLEDQLRSLTGVLPATHEEIAGVAEAAGQLGVARGSIASFTKTMIDLSETTNLSADEAATSIAQLMNIMKTAPGDVDNLGAALVALGNDGASTERDIIQMAQRIAGAGEIVGLTEAQVLGFANALASVGIEAEAGGSAVSRIMTDIAKSVSTGGEQLDKFAEVAGMSSKDFQKAFKEDPADAIATFVEGLARIDAAGGDVFTTLADLGQSDIRVSQALLGMANSGDLLRNSLELGSAAWKENTALLEEATKRYGTAEAKIQIAGNSIREAAIDWGSVFLPAVSAVAEVVADAAQGFAKLPEPIQATVAVTVALAAAAAAAGGAFLIGVPAIAQFNAQLAILRASELPGIAAAATGATTAITKTGAAMSAAARFMLGPWGLAIAAAAVGVGALQQVVDGLATSAEDFQNIITTGPTTAKLLEAGDKSIISALAEATDTAEGFRSKLELLGEGKEFLRGLSLPAQQLKSSLAEVGEQLATTAATDLPAAQNAFRTLAKEMELTDAEQKVLLSSMPGYEDALKRVASEQGIVVTSSDEAANKTALLALAFGDSEESGSSAADSYRTAAEEAATLTDDLRTLLDTFNEMNGKNQDAISANADYQASLAGIADEVQRQKDAYAEANGTLDGFALSLDKNTESGSANQTMLGEVARAAQNAALAQLDVDAATVGADQATQNYFGTLASQKQAFIDSALAAGFDADQVNILADSVFNLPSEKEVRVAAEAAAAQSAVDNLRWSIDRLTGKTVTVTYETLYKNRDLGWGVRAPDSERGNMFKGGRVQAFEDGGFPSGFYAGRPGGIHKFAEDTLPWEVYISPKRSERQRNLAIWAETGRLLGAKGFENGGFGQPNYASNRMGSSASSSIVQLSPEDRRLLRNLESVTNVMIDSASLTDAVNRQNSLSAWRGGA